MTVAERLPARNACIACTMSGASSPISRGTGEATPEAAAWQPEHAAAPAGVASAANAGAGDMRVKVKARLRAAPLAVINARMVFMSIRAAGTTAAVAAAAIPAYTSSMPWFFSGNERMRFPVAANKAFSTAGPATHMVGSPTPPQNPPEGMTIDSTLGICAMRIEL